MEAETDVVSVEHATTALTDARYLRCPRQAMYGSSERDTDAPIVASRRQSVPNSRKVVACLVLAMGCLVALAARGLAPWATALHTLGERAKTWRTYRYRGVVLHPPWRARVDRQPGMKTFVVHTGCVDAEVKSVKPGFFDVPIIAARLVRHNMGSPKMFDWDDGLEMTLVEVDPADAANDPRSFMVTTSMVNWEYGFALKAADGRVLYEIGMGGPQAKAHGERPAPLARIARDKSVDNSERRCVTRQGLYFNRVLTTEPNEEISYVFGSCKTQCYLNGRLLGNLPHQDQPNVPTPAIGVTMPAFPKLGPNHRQFFKFWRIRFLNDDLTWNYVSISDAQFFTDKSNYIAGAQQNTTSLISGVQPLSGTCFESDHYSTAFGCTNAFDGQWNTQWRARRATMDTETGSLGRNRRFTWAYIGLELPRAENVQHVRVNNFVWGGKSTFTGSGAGIYVVECSDDGDKWYEWAGSRLVAEDKYYLKPHPNGRPGHSAYDHDRINHWEDLIK